MDSSFSGQVAFIWSLAEHPAREVRPCVLDRTAPRGPVDRARLPDNFRASGDALAILDDDRFARDGQPHH